MSQRTPVVAGIGLSDHPVAPDLDGLQHHVQAMQRALDDCGIDKSEIDGYIGAGGTGRGVDDPVAMAEYLRIDHRYIDSTMTGGASFEFHVQHAAAAIREGLAEVILLTYGSDLLSKQGRMLGTGMRIGDGVRVPGGVQFEVPYGNVLIGAYAMAAQRHMHEYGTKPEQLAEIAVACRYHASLNPQAMYRTPITIDDVVSSRLIADPLRKLDCCAITDGGGAFIVTTEERAKDLRKAPVYVLGAAGAQTHWNIGQMPDFTTTAGAIAGPIAFQQAGVTPGDVDCVQFYNSFTITDLLLLEDLGFCGKGEGGSFVEDGRVQLGGELPLCTDGGGLSGVHPGMRGIFLIIEAVRQLRGEAADAQVPDCRIAVAAGSGGWLSCIGVVVLGRERP